MTGQLEELLGERVRGKGVEGVGGKERVGRIVESSGGEERVGG